MKDFFEREGVWDVIISQKSKCVEENFVLDILNVEVCKDLKSNGNFLENEYNLLLIFNIDGILLYQFLGIS